MTMTMTGTDHDRDRDMTTSGTATRTLTGTTTGAPDSGDASTAAPTVVTSRRRARDHTPRSLTGNWTRRQPCRYP